MAIRSNSFQPKPQSGWRVRLSDWKQKWATRDVQEVHEEIENYVYGCAVAGMKMSAIAHYFGIEKNLFDRAYGDVWRAGAAELEGQVTENTLGSLMASNIPVAKIYLTKTWGGRAENDSVDIDAGDSTVTVNIRRAVREQTEE
jgi:hypothetical protein